MEGRTEELCFPFIYEKTGEQPPPRGLILTAVINTGDFFTKRSTELIFQIYQRVHQAASPLVKSATFGFDRETLTDDEMRDLKKRAPGGLLFLPRRHFECFLLDPDAIAAFVTHHDLASAVFPEEVQGYLQSVGGDQKFEAAEHWKGNIFDEKWLAEVNAAKLLKETCYHFTDDRLSFNKTRDFCFRAPIPGHRRPLRKIRALMETSLESSPKECRAAAARRWPPAPLIC